MGTAPYGDFGHMTILGCDFICFFSRVLGGGHNVTDSQTFRFFVSGDPRSFGLNLHFPSSTPITSRAAVTTLLASRVAAPHTSTLSYCIVVDVESDSPFLEQLQLCYIGIGTADAALAVVGA